MNLTQGQIQNFKLGGAERRQAQNLLGYFVWKITILCQKIIFFPIAEGGRKFVEVFHLKNHDFTPTNHIFSNFRGPLHLDPPLWPIITLKRISHDLLFLTLDQLNFYTHKKYLYVHYYNREIPSLNVKHVQ